MPLLTLGIALMVSVSLALDFDLGAIAVPFGALAAYLGLLLGAGGAVLLHRGNVAFSSIRKPQKRVRISRITKRPLPGPVTIEVEATPVGDETVPLPMSALEHPRARPATTA
jgi:hypothetical protein